MTTRSKLAAGTALSPFAHLNRTPRMEGGEDEDNNDPNAEGEDREEGDDKDPKGKRKAKGKRAEGDGDDDTDDDGDDQTDAEDEKEDETAKARARERGRCAAIFQSAGAGRNPAAAAELAFNTNMPRSSAVRVLNALPAASAPEAPRGSRSAFRDRMAPAAIAPRSPDGGESNPSPGARLATIGNARRGTRSN